MYFTEIKLNNFGIYRGEHRIKLVRCTDGRNVTLVGGLNGRGKTTILEAIFLALYGRRSMRLIQNERISYEEFLRQHTNKSAAGSEASIELAFALEGSSSAFLQVKRSWPVSAKSVLDQLTVTRDGRSDTYLAKGWDYYVEQIIPLGIARFFFFDSEKIASIADDDAYEEVRASIQVLTGVQTVEQLLDDMRRLSRRREDPADDGEVAATAERTLSELQNQEDDLEGQSAKVAQRAAALKTAVRVAERKLKDLESRFWERGGQLEQSREQMVAEQQQTNELLQTLQQKVREAAYSAANPLLLCQPLLERTSTRLQEDEMSRAVRYSSHILRELQQNVQKEIASGLEEPHRSDLGQRVAAEFSRWLDRETAEELLSISPDTETAIRLLLAQAAGQRGAVSALLDSIDACSIRLLELELHLSYEADSSETSNLLDSIKQHNQELGSLQNELLKTAEQQLTIERQLEQLRLRRAQIAKEMSSQQQLLDDNGRITKYAAITEHVMTEFRRRLQRKKTTALEAEILASFRVLAQKEAVISDIKIDPDTLDITLMDYKGGQLQKSQLSAGEKQIFAIAILWGLSKSSGFRLPVIIDTPLGRLDSRHRTNLINRYLPHASEQVLVLSTDEEVNDNYYDLLEPYLNNSYTIVYDEVAKCSSIVAGYFGGDKG